MGAEHNFFIPFKFFLFKKILSRKIEKNRKSYEKMLVNYYKRKNL